MEYIYSGASIECNAAEIISRKVNFGSLIELKDIGRCRKYSCERNSESTILKELNPKNPLYKETSHLDHGDKLKGLCIVVYVKKITQIKVELINNTGRHKAQKAYSNDYTFAEITEIFPTIKKLKDPVQKFPSPRKLLKQAEAKQTKPTKR